MSDFFGWGLDTPDAPADDSGDNRPIRYVEPDPQNPGHDLVVYRASSVGSCIRALVASARGLPAAPWPDNFREILDEGTRMESTISAMWDNHTGVPTINSQGEIELEIGEIDDRRVIVRAHMDGMAGDDSATLREYKKFRPSTWNNFMTQGVECGDNYPWQVAIMMHGGGFERCEFVGGLYTKAVTNDDDLNDVVTEGINKVYGHVLTIPPIPLKAIKMKIAKVERFVNEGYDPMETPCVGKYPCGYYKLHDVAEVTGNTQLEAATTLPIDDRWIAKIAEYNNLRGQVAEYRKLMDTADKAAKEVRATILGRLQLEGIAPNTTTLIGDFAVKWVESERKEFVTKASTVVKLDITVPDVDSASGDASEVAVKKPTKKKSTTTRIGTST